MPSIIRSEENPLLLPVPSSAWESEAAYNPSVVEVDKTYHMFYRATSSHERAPGSDVLISTIGHATSKDGVHFGERVEFLRPAYDWERSGCEDPRVTAFEGRYYIFYTAVSEFSANGIKVAVAVSDDLKTVKERHLVTPFNAKAMALFPERINGKIVVIFTVDTDHPPAKICVAFLDKIEELWSEAYWKAWREHMHEYILPIDQNERDQIEVGSAPIKTDAGWLFFYSYIYNYFSPPATFGIQAVLLDLADPLRIVGEMKRPAIVPEQEYEFYGRIPRIVFPSGALIRRQTVYIYYGATDTTSCVAMVKLKPLLEELRLVAERQLKRFDKNPILIPRADHPWESKAAFNPAAALIDGKVHIFYRSMSDDNTSAVGLAISKDGFTIDERLPEPVYAPRESFESKSNPGGNSGCEDPRVSMIGDILYMCYTAYDGHNPPRVALTSIAVKDVIARRWNWNKAVLISPPGMDDKDAAIFPRKIGGKYWFFHRLGSDIWIDSVKDLNFDGVNDFLGGKILMRPRDTAWDSRRIGIAGPPIETKDGWLLLYHGISRRTGHYNIRAALLDLEDPGRILVRTYDTLLEPKMPYERDGLVPNVVFPCGAVVKDGTLFVYYGGADKVTGVATIEFNGLIEGLKKEAEFQGGELQT